VGLSRPVVGLLYLGSDADTVLTTDGQKVVLNLKSGLKFKK